MEKLQMDGTETFLLEGPQSERDKGAQRRIFYVLYVLFKHKLFITAAFLVLSLPVLIFALSRPTEYIAVAKVLIKPSRAFLGMSPTSEGSPLSIYPSPETINSEIQIVNSREVRERLAKEMPFHKNSGNRETRGPLTVTPVRASNLIQISLESSNPEWAAKVVNRATELYVAQHLKVHKTQGVEEFYEEQEKNLRAQLIEAEKALKEYQDREKIVDAPQELGSTLARLASFETTLKTTESGILEAQETISILERQLREQREHVASGKTIVETPVYSSINARIIQLQLERNSLLQRYTEDDRLVKDKDREIAELKSRLAAEVQRMVQGESVGLNPLHQGILASLLKERANLKALQARKNTLLQHVAGYSALSGELKKKGFLYDRLQQDLNAKKEALALYKKKAEEARISEAMDERKFGNVSIVEKASLPLARAGRSPWMMIIITVLGSIAVAVAGAFAIEFFNTTLRDEADVEEQIGLPVLATIQYYPIS